MTNAKVESERSLTLTEAILLTLQGSPGCSTAAEVKERLLTLGYASAQPTTVATILSRLAKDAQISSWKDPGGSGLVGYEWRTPRTKSEMLTANKAVAEMGKKGR